MIAKLSCLFYSLPPLLVITCASLSSSSNLSLWGSTFMSASDVAPPEYRDMGPRLPALMALWPRERAPRSDEASERFPMDYCAPTL